MNERWVPVVSAIVGVLGGLGGAIVGGAVANQGQLDQIEAERAQQVEDTLSEAYVDYLGAINRWLFGAGGQLTEDEILTAEARVSLLSSPPVGEAAAELTEAARVANQDEASVEEQATYFQEKREFIELAKRELNQ